jgi:hypothetical protein
MEMGLVLRESSMRSTQILRVLALAGLLPALGACNGGTEPEAPLAATYVLASVDGAAAPLVIADHRTPGGVRQVYSLLYDSISFQSPTSLRRALRAVVQSTDPTGARIPVVESGHDYSGRVTRRGSRVIVEYTTTGGGTVKPDTFRLRDASLVKMGPYGVSCTGCTPVRRVEYVYAPR